MVFFYSKCYSNVQKKEMKKQRKKRKNYKHGDKEIRENNVTIFTLICVTYYLILRMPFLCNLTVNVSSILSSSFRFFFLLISFFFSMDFFNVIQLFSIMIIKRRQKQYNKFYHLYPILYMTL